MKVFVERLFLTALLAASLSLPKAAVALGPVYLGADPQTVVNIVLYDTTGNAGAAWFGNASTPPSLWMNTVIEAFDPGATSPWETATGLSTTLCSDYLNGECSGDIGNDFRYEASVPGLSLVEGWGKIGIRQSSSATGEEYFPYHLVPVDGSALGMTLREASSGSGSRNGFAIYPLTASTRTTETIAVEIETVEDLRDRQGCMTVEYLAGSNYTGSETICFDDALVCDQPYPPDQPVNRSQSYSLLWGDAVSGPAVSCEPRLGSSQLQGTVRLTVGIEGFTSDTITTTMDADTYYTWYPVLVPLPEFSTDLSFSDTRIGIGPGGPETAVSAFWLY